jgi:hypothetical protein
VEVAASVSVCHSKYVLDTFSEPMFDCNGTSSGDTFEMMSERLSLMPAALKEVNVFATIAMMAS